MKKSDQHNSEDLLAPETRDESGTGAYEPPSITELGSFLELTAGENAGGGTDTGTTSTLN
jgi:hypothetical protein